MSKRFFLFYFIRYPLILSIEDNCTLPVQRKMAGFFRETFGEMLVTLPIDKEESALPSPYALRRKILLKHKKLPDGVDEGSYFVRNDDSRQDVDLRNTVMNGALFLKENKEWNPYFFVLTDRKLIYAETFSQTQETEAEEEDEGANATIVDVSDTTCFYFSKVLIMNNYGIHLCI